MKFFFFGFIAEVFWTDAAGTIEDGGVAEGSEDGAKRKVIDGRIRLTLRGGDGWR